MVRFDARFTVVCFSSSFNPEQQLVQCFYNLRVGEKVNAVRCAVDGNAVEEFFCECFVKTDALKNIYINIIANYYFLINYNWLLCK